MSVKPYQWLALTLFLRTHRPLLLAVLTFWVFWNGIRWVFMAKSRVKLILDFVCFSLMHSVKGKGATPNRTPALHFRQLDIKVKVWLLVLHLVLFTFGVFLWDSPFQRTVSFSELFDTSNFAILALAFKDFLRSIMADLTQLLMTLVSGLTFKWALSRMWYF